MNTTSIITTTCATATTTSYIEDAQSVWWSVVAVAGDGDGGRGCSMVAPEDYHTQGTIPRHTYTLPATTTATTAGTPPVKYQEQQKLVARGG